MVGMRNLSQAIQCRWCLLSSCLVVWPFDLLRRHLGLNFSRKGDRAEVPFLPADSKSTALSFELSPKELQLDPDFGEQYLCQNRTRI